MSSDALELRAPTDADLPALARWRNDVELQWLLLWAPGRFDDAGVRAWIARRTDDPDGAFFVVADASGAAIGFAQLTRIHRRDGHAYLGLMLDAPARGRGLAAQALAALEAEARRRGLRKLLLDVLVENERALRFYEKAGFRRVGVLVAHVRLDGRHADLVIMEKLLP